MLVLLSKLEVYLGTINYTTFNILYNLYICKELAMPEKKASKKLTISIQIAWSSSNFICLEGVRFM